MIVIYAVVGRVLIWFLQTNGWTRKIWGWNDFLGELGSCDFCMGVWVYIALAFVFDINLIAPYSIPIFSQIVSGILASLISHWASYGFRTKYMIIELD